ncbi:MAG TPA: 16S rRNA (cytidine(1402)-2'-O)-methyltransferase, partial [Bacillota bacterium]
MTEQASSGAAAGRLYVCATPIGNLEDVTLRLLRVLRDQVHVIAAEDTRQARRLCARYGIAKPLISCHERNEEQRANEILAHLQRGESVAFVSDAGTPGIADPGARLVARVRAAGFPVVPVPGPSAVTTALSVSGFGADAFLVMGFLPRRGEKRREALQRIAETAIPVVLFEAPHRIEATLADLAATLGERPIWVGRELTKAFESSYVGPAREVYRKVCEAPRRGEYTLVVGPAISDAISPAETEIASDLPLAAEVSLLVAAGLSEREAMR